MTVAAAVLALAIGGGLLWVLGGLVLRLGGALVFWAGLVGLLARGEAAGLLVALLGGLIWLTGQGHHLLRHGGVRSPLAQAMLRPLVDRPSGARSDRRGRGGEV